MGKAEKQENIFLSLLVKVWTYPRHCLHTNQAHFLLILNYTYTPESPVMVPLDAQCTCLS